MILVVLGKNWRRNRSGLSLESKMNATAAGELYRRQAVQQLIFSGGHTAGSGRPSEAEAMKRFLLSIFPEVPAEAILLEEQSIDTADNAARVGDLLRGDASAGIALLTTRAHGPAAVRLFSRSGMNVMCVYAAEDVVRLRSSHHQALIQRYARSCSARVDRAIEIVRGGLMTLDPGARSLRLLTRLIRR